MTVRFWNWHKRRNEVNFGVLRLDAALASARVSGMRMETFGQRNGGDPRRARRGRRPAPSASAAYAAAAVSWSHSFGGWTGVSLAGGRYDPVRQRAACAAMAKKDFYCDGTLKDDVSAVPVVARP